MFVTELWVYPVKGCRGTRVKSSELTPSGLAFDRAWCVVDLDGSPQREPTPQFGDVRRCRACGGC